MVVDVDCAVVETGQDPWLCRVEIHSFDAVRPGEQFPLLASGSLAGGEGDEDCERVR